MAHYQNHHPPETSGMAYPFSELVRVKRELAKHMCLVIEHQTEIEQAKEKISRQDAQLEEAADIMMLQQKALKSSEQERKKLEKELHVETQNRKLAEEKTERVEKSLKYTHLEISGLLDKLAGDANSLGNGKCELVPADWYQYKIRSLTQALENKFAEKLEQQNGLKAEIDKLRKTVEEMQKSLEERKERAKLKRIKKAEKEKVVVVSEPEPVPKKIRKFKRIITPPDSPREEVKLVIRKEDTQRQSRRWISCTQCKKQFLGSWALTQHTRKEHVVQRKTATFGCLECGFTYKTREMLQGHHVNCCKNVPPNEGKYDLVEIQLGKIYSSDGEETDGLEELQGKSIFLIPHM